VQGDPANQEDPNPPHSGMDIAAAILRGDIYSTGLRDCTGEGGNVPRPVLVIQNDVGNRYSQSIIVACVTSTVTTRHFPVIVEIPHGSIPGLAAIYLNQIMTVDKVSLGDKMGKLSPEVMARVDEALRVSLGLPRGG